VQLRDYQRCLAHLPFGKRLPNALYLHRKEQFLPPDHPRRVEFAALTAAEEAAGLYHDTTTIGFKLNWERLLAQKGLAIAGHHLLPTDAGTESAADPAPRRLKSRPTSPSFLK